MAASRHFIVLPMAPVVLPAVKTESFRLSGLGSLVLTEEQRQSRALTIVIEKVRPVNPDGSGVVIPSYFNNKYPEPQSHWGYWQMLARDFVTATGPFEYRRQVVYKYDALWAEVMARLRCFIEREHDYRNAVDETILGALGEGGPIPGTPNIDQLKAAWEASLESQLFPTVPETAIWYELADGWNAQITVTWQQFAVLNCGIEYQQAPPPVVPSQGQSGPPGERNSEPPPAGRIGDPLSDNASPPANSAVGPPVPSVVPPPPPGAKSTRLIWEYIPTVLGGGACATQVIRVEQGTVAGIFPLSAFTMVDSIPPQGGFACGGIKREGQLNSPPGFGPRFQYNLITSSPVVQKVEYF